MGQSPSDLQPHEPPRRHAWPAVDVVQSVHRPPDTPHSEPPGAPVTHFCVPVASQQPPLHASVWLWALTHTSVHSFFDRSQARPAAQSLVCLQPQLPETHWFVPLHAPHGSPPVPHTLFEVPAWQAPFSSQQPPPQEVALQVETHEPELHVDPVVHATHDAPWSPHVPFAEA